ncbi:hypothetical protein DV495_004182 [Geotrichum candidum]|mgnify:CR=1 FL=1|uniref:Uncharacterized protein n=1 Tax=Geotrichum candidum TaxID=1173061 RepID=A0A0J9XHK9_GEOCN|nr:hypothetical protein DV454_004874 [Geotrichum candidum]KAI9213150.1 hypothetical protein DS838_001954 [Geotrichum bryndzae]KAF5122796.1 hypothetical protein DV495_004182 [Geotrichum candidum]KAF5124652.1 hypothetical protein DV452_000034 [Geotrichum candidum]KAF7497221.1 hypothetical protein DV113_004736 [Geotrichum candidum]
MSTQHFAPPPTAPSKKPFFPGFCTPNDSIDHSDDDSDDELETQHQQRKPRSFFKSIHDQIRESENNSENNSDDEDTYAIKTPKSPPIPIKKSKSSTSLLLKQPPVKKKSASQKYLLSKAIEKAQLSILLRELQEL